MSSSAHVIDALLGMALGIGLIAVALVLSKHNKTLEHIRKSVCHALTNDNKSESTGNSVTIHQGEGPMFAQRVVEGLMEDLRALNERLEAKSSELAKMSEEMTYCRMNTESAQKHLKALKLKSQGEIEDLKASINILTKNNRSLSTKLKKEREDVLRLSHQVRELTQSSEWKQAHLTEVRNYCLVLQEKITAKENLLVEKSHALLSLMCRSNAEGQKQIGGGQVLRYADPGRST